jgi:hypothetical protein
MDNHTTKAHIPPTIQPTSEKYRAALFNNASLLTSYAKGDGMRVKKVSAAKNILSSRVIKGLSY